MRLTALGTGTVALVPHRACAGYYVEAGDARLLIDCGSGVTRRLAEQEIPWQTIRTSR
jgi:ribonuclease BN (tRNA processing enzyme)